MTSRRLVVFPKKCSRLISLWIKVESICKKVIQNKLTAQRSYENLIASAVQFPRKDACSHEQTALPSVHHCQPWPVCNEHQPRTSPPPTNIRPLSTALMQGLHEECLRLSAKALQSQLNAQDVNEASLWFGMAGQHLAETSFDNFIRPAASKMLNQILMTGVPLDRSAMELQLSKELSARVGWDVSGQIHGMFVSNLNDDIQCLGTLSANGLSSSLIQLSKEMAAGEAQLAPANFAGHTKQPHIQLIQSSTGGRSSGGSGSIASQICSGLSNTESVAGGTSVFLMTLCSNVASEAFIDSLFELPGACAGMYTAFGGVAGLTHMLRSSVCQ